MAGFWENVLEVAGRGAEGMVDNLSNNPAGAFLQAAVNTDEYKYKQARQKFAQDMMQEQLKENAFNEEKRAEWKADAPVRESDRKAKLLANSEFIDAAPVRDSDRQTNLSQNKARQAASQVMVDTAHGTILKTEEDEAAKIAENRLMANEGYRNLSDLSKQEFKNTENYKQIKAWILYNRLYGKSRNDPNYKAVLGKKLEEDGGYSISEQDGQAVLNDRNRNLSIPMTWDNYDKVNGLLENSVNNEISARMEMQGPRDNVYKNSIFKLAKAAAPVSGGSVYKAKQDIVSHIQKYPELERNEFVLSENFADAKSDGVLTKEEMAAILPQMKGITDKIGWRVHVDEENPLNSKVEVEGGALLPIETAIGEIAKRNTIRSDWEAGIAVKKQKMEAEAKRQATEDLIQTNKALVGQQKLKKETADETADMSEEEKAVYDSGAKFIKDKKLDGAAAEIWRQRGSNKKLTSKGDVVKLLGLAAEDAQQAYLEEDDESRRAEKAQAAFSKTLKQYGVQQSLIPDLWGDADLEAKIKDVNKKLPKAIEDYAKDRTPDVPYSGPGAGIAYYKDPIRSSKEKRVYDLTERAQEYNRRKEERDKTKREKEDRIAKNREKLQAFNSMR